MTKVRFWKDLFDNVKKMVQGDSQGFFCREKKVKQYKCDLSQTSLSWEFWEIIATLMVSRISSLLETSEWEWNCHTNSHFLVWCFQQGFHQLLNCSWAYLMTGRGLSRRAQRLSHLEGFKWDWEMQHPICICPLCNSLRLQFLTWRIRKGFTTMGVGWRAGRWIGCSVKAFKRPRHLLAMRQHFQREARTGGNSGRLSLERKKCCPYAEENTEEDRWLDGAQHATRLSNNRVPSEKASPEPLVSLFFTDEPSHIFISFSLQLRFHKKSLQPLSSCYPQPYHPVVLLWPPYG